MHQNLHVYRNLGVVCLIAKCSHCSRATAHSVHFEIDKERNKLCSLGCTECGRGRALRPEDYESFYEASFEYDRWQDGEIEFEEYQEALPEAFRPFALPRAQEEKEIEWVCPACSKSVPDSLSECWNCEYVKPDPEENVGAYEEDPAKETGASVNQKTTAPTIELKNGLAPLLSFGVSLGLAVQALLFGFAYLDLLPNILDWFQEDATGSMGDHSWGTRLWYPIGMLVSVLIGTAMSYRRFPKRITFAPQGIQILPRGRQVELRYGYESVRDVRYSKHSKYLTLWLVGGKAFLVAIKQDDVIEIRNYFQESS
ncbi:hypothetical protein [Pelagicoccus mobilis]|uniref:RanBP2-type domain-containing protein n=1 Tax=Pelagicoccus mobilis TaxID=415221 RepID=A0A934RYU2_9BACT|nr:hypothetical protein [Pelagicoccus mobilis]MBK1878848.1 hypothetical protein [Pelagicoccus mobilis]